ncbi:magnesium transporter CorA family protein [Candidatus Uhrbacteria bacterium]|nr:magnesium transporter CorA family protein [Candidatus Uhrbacteria bacterium]
MTTIYYKSIKDKSLRTLETARVGCWIHVEQPTTAEIKKIAEQYGLDEGHLTDAIDQYEVPRVEREGETIYVFVRYPTSDGDETLTTPILIILSENMLLTVCPKVFPQLSRFINGTIEFSTTQKVKLFLLLLLQISSAYTSFLNRINRDIRRLGIQIERITSKEILQFVTLERIVSDFLSALLPTHGMLQSLLSGKIFKLYKEDQDLIEDIFLNKGQLIEMCRSNIKLIGNIRSAYSSIMSHNLNRVIKLLTSLTILVTIPTMVASLYGMNVRLPFADAPHAFWGILIFIFAISTLLTLVFVRNRWL